MLTILRGEAVSYGMSRLQSREEKVVAEVLELDLTSRLFEDVMLYLRHKYIQLIPFIAFVYCVLCCIDQSEP